MAKIKTIGVLRCGGDVPGLSAIIRGVVRSEIKGRGMRAVGITFGDSV